MSKATTKTTAASSTAAPDTSTTEQTSAEETTSSDAGNVAGTGPYGDTGTLVPPVAIKPTIGRRVWYWPSESERTADPMAGNHVAQLDPTQACDAGIAFVWSDVLVNLTIADHNGILHTRTSVRLLQPGELERPDGGFAEWMPYQVGTASRSAS